MVDVLLINSNIPSSLITIPNVPLGIAQLASCLEKEGISVDILDLDLVDFDKEKALEKKLRLGPKIVGISSSSISIPEAVNIARKVKTLTNAVTIIGGYHVRGDPNFINKFNNMFDYELVGEGEISFTNFVKKVLKNQMPNERVIFGKPLKDIERLPFPAYHLLDMNKYRRASEMIVMSSRGCPYTCFFCCSSRREVRYRKPKTFVEELILLKEKYKIKKFQFSDENFTINKKHARNVCLEILKEKIDLKWRFQTRCNLIDKKTFEIAKKSGCGLVQFGVETLSENIQKAIKKNITLNDVKMAVKLCKELGLKVGLNLMFGLPEERKIDLKNSFYILRELNPDYVWVSISIPYPGTELFELAVKDGLDKEIWNRYARGETQNIPIFLNRNVKKIYYSYYFTRIFLSFPSIPLINWLLVNNVRILSPNFSTFIKKIMKLISPFTKISSEKTLMLLNRFDRWEYSK